MLNANLCLQQENAKYVNAQAQRSSTKKVAVKPRNPRKKTETEDGFHYIAYVPVDGFVWRFDGLLQQPTNIGRECSFAY